VTPARLLLDEMLSPKIGAGLEDRGHDVDAVTQRPDLMALHDDEPILAAATAEGRIMVTTNIGDFAVLDARWAAESRTHAGIVFVTTAAFLQDRSFIGSVVKALHAAATEKALPAPGQTLYLRPPR
jgi:predicted nuclease of predicted toxin-antitoxin system